ncbi:hypothetical protein MCHI_000290 [Candidatus Magnetoovum chiemensis]|nr:hypothetical protein MCHI_000290 [Candidatus Magnetoovum chiemensis]
MPYFFNELGKEKSSQLKTIASENKENADLLIGILNSSLFYIWFSLFSDSRHVNMREVSRFPINLNQLQPEYKGLIIKLSNLLMDDYKKNCYRK